MKTYYYLKYCMHYDFSIIIVLQVISYVTFYIYHYFISVIRALSILDHP